MKNYLKHAIRGNTIKSYITSVNDVAKKVSNKSRKSKLLIMIDIIMCTIKYSASPNNYFKFQFYKMDNYKRNTYVTHGMSKKLINHYNNDKYRDIFEDKVQFAEKFKLYFGREWIQLKDLDFENLKKFINNKRQVIFKPIDSSQGQGIEILKTDDFKDYDHIYNHLKDKHGENGIVEEWIVQHKEISRLYNESVNPVRVITIQNNEECNILVASLTIGNGGYISNASCNDMVAPIDIKSGVIKFPAEDLGGRIYKQHPITGETIVGFRIPYWEDIIKLLNIVCKIVPEVKYVGWDIAITPKGPVLIEGNTSPGYKFFQLPSHLPDQIGMKPIYEKFL